MDGTRQFYLFQRYGIAEAHRWLADASRAGWTGLEPAASGVTGRRYNQLNYHPKSKAILSDVVSEAKYNVLIRHRLSVGETGLEPVAFWV